MVDTEGSWLGAIIAKHEKDKSIVKVLSVDTEPAVKEGDNYASVILRANLKVILGSGKITTKKVILKKSLPNIPNDMISSMSKAFILEGLVYENMFAQFEKMIDDHNLPYSKFWPDCLHASPSIIIFEDLKVSGFTLGSRNTGLDPIHAKMVFKHLARLHSLSVVAMANGTILSKILPPYGMSESGFWDPIFRVTMKSLADVIRDKWGSEWADVEKKMRYLMTEIIPTIKKLYQEPHKLSVINHGDCWVNNLMFKHDLEGLPLELKFVDLQVSHHNSYAWDLAYFLHTSVHPKNIESCFDSLIEDYSVEFSENLARLGFDPSVAPTIDEIKDELTRLAPFSIAVSASILPVTANPSNIKISLEEMLDEEGTKFREFYEDQQFEVTIKAMLQRFIKLGAFNKIN